MISVIFQVLQIASNYMASWVKTKRNIIIFKLSSSLANVLMLMSVGQFIGALPVMFTAVRTALFIFKDKYKTNFILYLCTAVYVIIALFTVRDIVDLLPTVISIAASFIIWFGSPINIKIGLSITDSIWVCYYIIVGLYISALNIVIQIAIAIISLIRIKIYNKKNNI